MFEWEVESTNRLNVLYDDVARHYHVIGKFTGSLARTYVCKECHKACTSDVTHACGQTCSDSVECHSCAFSNVRIHRLNCNSHFRIHTCFANHKQKRSVCERK